jgi:signal peptidase II
MNGIRISLGSAFIRGGIVTLVTVVDQLTKLWIEGTLSLYERIPITSFFNITKAYNSGAAFSLLSEAGGWQRWFFITVSSIVSIILVVWLWRMPARDRLLGVGIALVLGGALGNLIDRVLYGYVIDSIQIYWRDWYFPTFNVADIGITCGAAILVTLSLFEKSDERVSTP